MIHHSDLSARPNVVTNPAPGPRGKESGNDPELSGYAFPPARCISRSTRCCLGTIPTLFPPPSVRKLRPDPELVGWLLRSARSMRLGGDPGGDGRGRAGLLLPTRCPSWDPSRRGGSRTRRHRLVLRDAFASLCSVS